MPQISEPLPSEQLRRKKLAEQEAVTGIVWTSEVGIEVSRKIFFIYKNSSSHLPAVEERVELIRSEHSGSAGSISSISKTLDEKNERFGSVDRLDCISAIGYALDQLAIEMRAAKYGNDEGWADTFFYGEQFREKTNEVFLNHRVEWVFLNEGLLPRGNQELFTAVIKPATELLGSKPKWLATQRTYEKALTELARNDPGDAITDAATALQEMFRARGVEGSSIGAQAKKAISSGILLGHDQKLVDAVVSLSNWVEADRSNLGDAHYDASEADLDNAWLTIHVVGALILRLSGEDFRNNKFAPEPPTRTVQEIVQEMLGNSTEYASYTTDEAEGS